MNIIKELWLEILYPILCVVAPCIIFQILLYKKNGRKLKDSLNKLLIWKYIFIIYISITLKVAGMATLWDIGKYDTIIRLSEINIIPFKSNGMLTYILNIIMFMPMGFLLPYVWNKYQNIFITIMTSALFSFLIEIGQLFNRRKTDIDDLIMNTLGAIIGFLSLQIFIKIFGLKLVLCEKLIKNEALIYIVISVLGRFMFYNWRFFTQLFYF